MNQGQFEAITKRLDRLIELLEAQHQPAEASAIAVQEAVEGLMDGAELPKPTVKRSKKQ